jgi:hypothetical protein
MERKDLPMLSHDVVLALVIARQHQIASLRATNEALRAEIDPLKRGGTRQAEPFSKGTRVAEPEPPGSKPGSNTFRARGAPPPETITQPPAQVR